MRTRIVRYYKQQQPMIPSAIQAGGSIIGGVINGLFANSQNKKNNAWQSKEAEKNRDWQEQMYQQYQSPQAQAQQMAAAGINPTGAVDSPSSVGSGSTASLPPQQPIDVYTPIAGATQAIVEGLERRERLARMKEETRGMQLDNYRKAFENGNLEEVYEYQKKLIDADLESKFIDKKEAEVRYDTLKLAYDQQKEASEKGINPFEDDHDVKRAGIDKTKAEKDQIRQNIENLKVDHAQKSFLLSLSYLYDSQDRELDYNHRKAIYNEFIRTSENRVHISKIEKELHDIAHFTALRAEVLDELNNQIEVAIAEQVLGEIKDGNNVFDGILLNWFLSHPNETANVITTILGHVK